MKNIFIILSVFSFQFSELKAQKFGISGGIGLAKRAISSYNAPGTIDKKSILAYQFGSIVDFTLSESLHLEFGLFYSSKGYQFKYMFDFLELLQKVKHSLG